MDVLERGRSLLEHLGNMLQQLLTLTKEKSGESKGEVSLSRVLPLFLGITLVGAWWLWFLGVLGVPLIPVIAWDTISGGMTWLGVTFLGSVLPLVMNYWEKSRTKEAADIRAEVRVENADIRAEGRGEINSD